MSACGDVRSLTGSSDPSLEMSRKEIEEYLTSSLATTLMENQLANFQNATPPEHYDSIKDRIEPIFREVYFSKEALALVVKVVQAQLDGLEEQRQLCLEVYHGYITPKIVEKTGEFFRKDINIFLRNKVLDGVSNCRTDLELSLYQKLFQEFVDPKVDSHQKKFDGEIEKIQRQTREIHEENLRKARQIFEEKVEKTAILFNIAKLLECSLENLLEKICQKFTKTAAEVDRFSLGEYRTILADLHADRLLKDEAKGKRTRGRIGGTSKPIRKSKAPAKKAVSQMPKSAAACSSQINFEMHTRVARGKKPLTLLQKGELFCGELLLQKTTYAMLPRVTRWHHVSESAILRQFDGYESLSEEELLWKRVCHCFPGIDKLLSNPTFQKVYFQPNFRGGLSLVELIYKGQSFFGKWELGINGGMIYHSYFKPLEEGASIFQLLTSDATSFDYEESFPDDEGFIGTFPFKFSIDPQGVLNVTYDKEEHSLRIYPLCQGALQEKLNAMQAITV